jgi:hypothetical protein
MMVRQLTEGEKKAISRIAERLSEKQRTQLTNDLTKAMVVSESRTDDGGSHIVFEIAGYQRPSYEGQRPFHVEGKVKDKDGADITVLLHADQNERLLELELIRWGNERIISADWNSLELF